MCIILYAAQQEAERARFVVEKVSFMNRDTTWGVSRVLNVFHSMC